jgi:hypothetical protein
MPYESCWAWAQRLLLTGLYLIRMLNKRPATASATLQKQGAHRANFRLHTCQPTPHPLGQQVKAHTGIAGNELADEAATPGRRLAQPTAPMTCH